MIWTKSRSMERPEIQDTESSSVYNYVRKNIKEMEDGGFEYDECKIKKDEWGLYQELIQTRADVDYLTMLTEDL